VEITEEEGKKTSKKKKKTEDFELLILQISRPIGFLV
jgi:hypothetical protein